MPPTRLGWEEGPSPVYPVLFRWGGVVLYTHDFFSVLAVGVGFAIYWWELRRRGWLEARIVWISLAALLGAVFGARLITVWERPQVFDAFTSLPITVAIEQSGKSLIGAIAGGYLAIALSKRAFGYTRSTGDAYAFAIPVATAIGRIGCFLSELPLGTPTTLPWGISVSPAAAAQFASCPGCDLPMHPTMLYEIGFNVLAAGIVWRYRGRVPVAGDALKLYLLAAGIFRFLVEFIRTSPREWLGLTAPQWVLIPLVIILVAHFAREARRRAWRVPTAPPALVVLEGHAVKGGLDEPVAAAS